MITWKSIPLYVLIPQIPYVAASLKLLPLLETICFQARMYTLMLVHDISFNKAEMNLPYFLV